MSDDLKKFLKKHDVQMEAPTGEWTRLKSKITETKPNWFFGFLPRPLALGLATLGVAALAVVNFSKPQTPIMERTSSVAAPLSNEEAADFLSESFADLDDENDLEDEGIFEL
jgi:hypothetical protein